jgi:hypothetical protein
MAYKTEFEKLALSVEDAVEASSIGRSTLYCAISSGDLIARKRGRRTIILKGDLARFLEALPCVKPTDEIRNNFEFEGSDD